MRKILSLSFIFLLLSCSLNSGKMGADNPPAKYYGIDIGVRLRVQNWRSPGFNREQDIKVDRLIDSLPAEGGMVKFVVRNFKRCEVGFIIYQDEYGDVHSLIKRFRTPRGYRKDSIGDFYTIGDTLYCEVEPNPWPRSRWIRVGISARNDFGFPLASRVIIEQAHNAEALKRVGGRLPQRPEEEPEDDGIVGRIAEEYKMRVDSDSVSVPRWGGTYMFVDRSLNELWMLGGIWLAEGKAELSPLLDRKSGKNLYNTHSGPRACRCDWGEFKTARDTLRCTIYPNPMRSERRIRVRLFTIDQSLDIWFYQKADE